MTEKISWRVTLGQVHERMEMRHVSGVGKDAIFKRIPAGWEIQVSAPDKLVIRVDDKPPFQSGQTLIMSLESINANP